jgi:hypothetical protein
MLSLRAKISMVSRQRWATRGPLLLTQVPADEKLIKVAT